MNRLRFVFIFLMCLTGVVAGAVEPWADPSVAAIGKAKPRAEFVSYDIRESAMKGVPSAAKYYAPLTGSWQVKNTNQGDIPVTQYGSVVTIPYMWQDRDIYLHVDGAAGAYVIAVNGRAVGYSEDSRTPAEFDVSKVIKDGENIIAIDVYGESTGTKMEGQIAPLRAGSLGDVYLYSQPKLCISDFTISATIDSLNNNGFLDMTVIMSNSYNSTEKITLGYDVYTPQGKLLTYNLKETEIEGRSTDTLHFREVIYGAIKNKWTAASPTLYKCMLYVRRDGRFTEYIPFRVGFRRIDLTPNGLTMNDKKLDITPVQYNAASSEATTRKEIMALKKQRFNTIYVDYPQPIWFYDLCDELGMYVVDQANINTSYRLGDRNVGGSLVNAPAWLPAFIDRTERMQARSKNSTSVIALSLGGDCGNGYNMYKAFQHLKQIDSMRHVSYKGAEGEWNSEFALPNTTSRR